LGFGLWVLVGFRVQSDTNSFLLLLLLLLLLLGVRKKTQITKHAPPQIHGILEKKNIKIQISKNSAKSQLLKSLSKPYTGENCRYTYKGFWVLGLWVLVGFRVRSDTNSFLLRLLLQLASASAQCEKEIPNHNTCPSPNSWNSGKKHQISNQKNSVKSLNFCSFEKLKPCTGGKLHIYKQMVLGCGFKVLGSRVICFFHYFCFCYFCFYFYFCLV
jgi:hypothetical protein